MGSKDLLCSVAWACAVCLNMLLELATKMQQIPQSIPTTHMPSCQANNGYEVQEKNEKDIGLNKRA